MDNGGMSEADGNYYYLRGKDDRIAKLEGLLKESLVKFEARPMEPVNLTKRIREALRI